MGRGIRYPSFESNFHECGWGKNREKKKKSRHEKVHLQEIANKWPKSENSDKALVFRGGEILWAGVT